VSGETLSVFPLDGDWSRLGREYWWRALVAVELPPRPTALLVGLGGATQVHLLHRLAAPRLVTIIERDPTILRVAQRWFGLDAVGRLEVLCADAALAVPALARARRRFDFVMDDASYALAPDRAAPLALSLAPLVARGGTLVVNRHQATDDAPRVAAALRKAFGNVRLHRGRRGEGNVLIVCREPGRPAPAGQARGRRL